MTSQVKYVPPTEQYKEWLRTNPIKKLTEIEKNKLKNELSKKIINELNVTGEMKSMNLC
jgi:hypothetical protein